MCDYDEEFDEELDCEMMDYPELLFSEISLEAGTTMPWESKLGGCPYLRAQEEYPIGKNGKPMLFLAQLNLKDIHGIPELPDYGLLQFFVEQNDMFGLVYGEESGAHVRWIEDVVESEDGLLLEHPFADEAYLTALPFEEPGKISFAPTQPLEPEEDEESGPEICMVGGYPYFPQDGELEPDEFLLLQLADEGECGISYGDCGACRFIIGRDALAARDFSDVYYSWDCC